MVGCRSASSDGDNGDGGDGADGGLFAGAPPVEADGDASGAVGDDSGCDSDPCGACAACMSCVSLCCHGELTLHSHPATCSDQAFPPRQLRHTRSFVKWMTDDRTFGMLLQHVRAVLTVPLPGCCVAVGVMSASGAGA